MAFLLYRLALEFLKFQQLTAILGGAFVAREGQIVFGNKGLEATWDFVLIDVNNGKDFRLSLFTGPGKYQNQGS